ncbi:killer cell lectin-like receptor subfamily B member 1B allele B isoform X1 [Pelodiscus sinensis]|uniref:killer cell lectin-like receptor subfamily B member 1B allele B isoform X1 n=1 Tax=Pelodiscus sinensis TaxID=13735 RepID=UPI003F6B6034
MEDEEGYTVLNLKSRGGRSAVPPAARIPGAQCPWWHRAARWGGWAGNMVLLVAVIVLGMWVSHLASEKGQTPAAPGSDGAGSRDAATAPGSGDPSTAACSARLDRVRSQLCPPAQPSPAGGAGCKLCPSDWRLRGDKCYWVSTENKTWNKSRSDCAKRGSQLLVIRDREELEALQDLTQGSSKLWVGLSHPSPEKTWTWMDGSRLDETRLRVSGPAEGTSCGMMKGNQIQSEGCSSGLQWICQRDAVPL